MHVFCLFFFFFGDFLFTKTTICLIGMFNVSEKHLLFTLILPGMFPKISPQTRMKERNYQELDVAKRYIALSELFLKVN